jgi:cbb3-type cytochrome oxidase subunit 1
MTRNLSPGVAGARADVRFVGRSAARNPVVSERFIKIAALYLVFGAGLGMYMDISQDFSLTPVHAHVLLAGWLTLAMAGVVYRAYPAATGTRLAAAHFWLHNLGLPVFMAGLGLMVTGKATLQPVIAAGASAVLLGLVCLAINLWRRL